MINASQLTADCRRKVIDLEADLRERVAEVPELEAKLKADHTDARAAGRYSGTFNEFCGDQFTQSAVAWVLACVFARFLEDNGLLDQVWIADADGGTDQAREERELYFQQHATHSDRDYLEMVFRQVAELPGCGELFDDRHNPIWRLPISGDAASDLLKFFQEVDPDTGSLLREFQEEEWQTRFLGDLYQDLSDSARKKYALLQTPEFVEEFILDLTLEPAVDEFGLAQTSVIDPTCGSGHFLLGAFQRLFKKWQRQEPGTAPRELARRALVAVAGVDLNPFAVAIARFRLLIVALHVSGVHKLAKAPVFEMNLAVGDSLLHGSRFSSEHSWGAHPQALYPEMDQLGHLFSAENPQDLREVLGRQYAVVVGNPPYITVKDKALNAAYRNKYGSCHRKYSLGVPFTERFFDLAHSGEDSGPAGYVGLITTNSFTKREFGKKLIEKYLPKLDLTYVIDTSGAYIPGHGTPTVIMAGRNRKPGAETIRTAMGIRGEPNTPDDAASGKVWRSIVTLLNRPGSENEYISVNDKSRSIFNAHPWSLQGGGAIELKALLEGASICTLGSIVDSIGITSFTLEDNIYLLGRATARRRGLAPGDVRPMVIGEIVRDWSVGEAEVVLFPYDSDFCPLPEEHSNAWYRYLWPARTVLSNSKMFGGKTKVETGLRWYEFGRLTASKLKTPLSIVFAFVATHNHFVFDRGGRVFNRSAPVIKLPPDATVDDHLTLLGLLNSSTACFWMKQVFFNKGDSTDSCGARVTGEPEFDTHEFACTGLLGFPVVDADILLISKELDRLSQKISDLRPGGEVGELPEKLSKLTMVTNEYHHLVANCIALQEELDWQVYGSYGITEESLFNQFEVVPAIEPGQRAFEIALARKVESGQVSTTWFERNDSKPITEIPQHWPTKYQRVVTRRIEKIETDRDLALIERPEYKRRWNTESWDKQLHRACADWLLACFEEESLWPRMSPCLLSCAQLADLIRSDEDAQKLAAVYAGRLDFDLTKLVEDLVVSESVPFLCAERFKPSGQRKHDDWKRTWHLQRREDELDARRSLVSNDAAYLSETKVQVIKQQQVGDIPVPPRFTSADFRGSAIWKLRGKLDVPKERFFSLPGCERGGDESLVVGWAGWNHLEQVQAIAAYYSERKDQDGWPADRLAPLLAGIRERLFWVKLWHNDIDPEFGTRMGDTYESFVAAEAATLNLTIEQIDAAVPSKPSRRRRSRGSK